MLLLLVLGSRRDHDVLITATPRHGDDVQIGVFFFGSHDLKRFVLVDLAEKQALLTRDHEFERLGGEREVIDVSSFVDLQRMRDDGFRSCEFNHVDIAIDLANDEPVMGHVQEGCDV